ncbi:DinB family protein [Oricola sp.]|uniref:DinB family protein n=1 Tax=Oricola sp. TaxID=1979950 RepID=UPI0026003F3B|nr:DinB family protein [Oricola sp.]MCI5077198.1 DinB family protein [Oricola sp.]
MDGRTHYRMFAAYNRWANGRLFDAAELLSEEEWDRDVGAYFGSMCGTLNHILVADRIWMHRFTGTGETHRVLADLPHPQFGALRTERGRMDERIVDWVETLSEETLAGLFSYVPVTSPKEVTQALSPALAHFFNHQTHHRGHAHMILSVLGHEPPSLDLIYFLRTEEGSPFT